VTAGINPWLTIKALACRAADRIKAAAVRRASQP